MDDNLVKVLLFVLGVIGGIEGLKWKFAPKVVKQTAEITLATTISSAVATAFSTKDAIIASITTSLQQTQQELTNLSGQAVEAAKDRKDLLIRIDALEKTQNEVINQNKEQEIRLTDLEEWKTQANARMDETDAVIAAHPDGPNISKQIKTPRPNGKRTASNQC